MIEVEYYLKHKGSKLSIYYTSDSYWWNTWLEGTGYLGCGEPNATDTLARVNAKLGTAYTPADFKCRENGRLIRTT
jgi:hypothetical protein